MFDPRELAKTLKLHEQGYELLRWVGKNLRTGSLSFAVTDQATSSYDAAREWITRHWTNLPASVRPPEDALEPFARPFSSYLATSFTLTERPRAKLVTYCGCNCSYCTYLGQADRLQVRTPSKAAKRLADELKRIYLSAVAKEIGVSDSIPAVERLLAADDLRQTVAMATYARELIRRCQFASQGEGVLVLWRQFAWNANGTPIAKFRLRADAILQAEQRIVVRLREG